LDVIRIDLDRFFIVKEKKILIRVFQFKCTLIKSRKNGRMCRWVSSWMVPEYDEWLVKIISYGSSSSY